MPVVLTEAEIDTVREICDIQPSATETAFAITTALTVGLNDSQKTRIKSDVVFWEAKRKLTLDLVGEGVLSIAEAKLNRIRRFTRIMLGLSAISEVQQEILDSAGSGFEVGSFRMMSGRSSSQTAELSP